MVDRDYKKARAAALKELKTLLATQQQTEERILHLRNMIAALDALSDSSKPRETPRLTEAIRSIFKASHPGEALSASELRRHLLEMGYDLNKYSNFLASIHVVLRRLSDKGEIARMADSTGTIFYQRSKNETDWLEELEGRAPEHQTLGELAEERKREALVLQRRKGGQQKEE